MEPCRADYEFLCDELIAIGAEVGALLTGAHAVDQAALLRRIDGVNIRRYVHEGEACSRHAMMQSWVALLKARMSNVIPAQLMARTW